MSRGINKEGLKERYLSSLDEHGHTEIEISARFIQHLRRFFPILSLSRGSFLPLATHLNFGVLTVSLLSLHRDCD